MQVFSAPDLLAELTQHIPEMIDTPGPLRQTQG